MGADSADRLLGRAGVCFGLVRTGVSAFRNSVYATGGVIGVFRPSSTFMVGGRADEGVSTISDGNEAV